MADSQDTLHTPGHTAALYGRVAQALEEYAAEIVDILDHVSDNEGADSYGMKSLKISELMDEWELHRELHRQRAAGPASEPESNPSPQDPRSGTL